MVGKKRECEWLKQCLLYYLRVRPDNTQRHTTIVVFVIIMGGDWSECES